VTHFGLRGDLPHPAGHGRLLPATTHELALHDLERAVSEGEPICLLRGNTGLGKTLLVRRSSNSATTKPSAPSSSPTPPSPTAAISCKRCSSNSNAYQASANRKPGSRSPANA